MSEAEEKTRGFKVEDRRRFSADGEIRADVSEESPQPKDAAPADAQPGIGEPTAEPAPPTSPEPQAAEAELTFAGFVVSLSTQALMHLGEVPDPQTGKPERDLVAAQQVIDILGMLRDKTRGNLDQDEQALVDAILFDLRMKYVELARHAR